MFWKVTLSILRMCERLRGPQQTQDWVSMAQIKEIGRKGMNISQTAPGAWKISIGDSSL